MPAIRIGKKLGYRVVATDLDPEAVGAGEADAFYPVSTRDLEGTLDIGRKEGISGITSIVSETATVTVAKVAETLGFERAEAIDEEFDPAPAAPDPPSGP